MSSWYYDIGPEDTLQTVIDKWQKEGLKAYDRSMPMMVPVKELWPRREYTWTRETSRDGHVKVKDEFIYLPGPQKWDALVENLRTEGWRTEGNSSLHFEIGRKGGTKVGEGNHRLAIARKLGMKEVPVWFHFMMGRVTKQPQFEKEPVVKVKPEIIERVVERAEEKKEMSPEEIAHIEEMLNEILGFRSNKHLIAAINPYDLEETLETLDEEETQDLKVLDLEANELIRRGIRDTKDLLTELSEERRIPLAKAKASLKHLIELGALKQIGDKVRITPVGRDLVDEVAKREWNEEGEGGMKTSTVVSRVAGRFLSQVPVIDLDADSPEVQHIFAAFKMRLGGSAVKPTGHSDRLSDYLVVTNRLSRPERGAHYEASPIIRYTKVMSRLDGDSMIELWEAADESNYSSWAAIVCWDTDLGLRWQSVVKLGA